MCACSHVLSLSYGSWDLLMCDTSYVWLDLFVCVHLIAVTQYVCMLWLCFIRVTRLIYVCDTSYIWRNLFVCVHVMAVTVCVHVMAVSYVWRDVFMCYVCDTSYAWHSPFICVWNMIQVTHFIHMCTSIWCTSIWYVWYNPFICVSCSTFVWYGLFTAIFVDWR